MAKHFRSATIGGSRSCVTGVAYPKTLLDGRRESNFGNQALCSGRAIGPTEVRCSNRDFDGRALGYRHTGHAGASFQPRVPLSKKQVPANHSRGPARALLISYFLLLRKPLLPVFSISVDVILSDWNQLTLHERRGRILVLSDFVVEHIHRF
jgi:hypothetical protein